MRYRCRTVLPKVSNWFEIEADRPEDAANEFFFQHDNDVPHIAWREGGGPRILFARVEVDGHDTWVARSFHHGIFRKGGVRPASAPRSLDDVARLLQWESDPQALVESGWDGEETMEDATEREAREREQRRAMSSR